MSDEEECVVRRIHGSPEEWLREFIDQQLKANAGRIYGVCVHLEITEEGGETSGCVSYINWPSSAQLQGRLHTTITQLSLKHLGLMP